MQSNLIDKLHLGIIMDGNGRWATSRGLSRGRGHQAGVKAIRPIVEAAAEAGVGTLTLYAFSSDNWRRPALEVSGLMGLLRRYLDKEVAGLSKAGIRLGLIGRRDRLPAGTIDRIATAERETANGDRLHLRIAFDYSARDMILAAAAKTDPSTSREAFASLVAGDGAPDVDLLIRTGGEQRLSDFLLWESAYAELLFVDKMWPEFRPEDLAAALAWFRSRQRRFGGVSQPANAA
ncbi:MAG TPA: di-trans,poly-cis-decaprenylcistransferase [Pseudorhizobium sp.]|jgi:undecaprenyl diphosphate synthase|nr:di-trans,poly-cis-decaprenylcistransferase [Pseudorhizobium sp.]